MGRPPNLQEKVKEAEKKESSLHQWRYELTPEQRVPSETYVLKDVREGECISIYTQKGVHLTTSDS